MIALAPHDLLPRWIHADTDWYSFAGNTASVAGVILSIIALAITISVKRQVRKIEREYVMRLKNRKWVAEIEKHTERLLTIYETQPFQANDAKVELTKTSSLVKTLSEQVPPDFARDAVRVVRALEQHRPRWWRIERPLDAKRTFDLYLILIEFAENLRHLAVKFETNPTR